MYSGLAITREHCLKIVTSVYSNEKTHHALALKFLLCGVKLFDTRRINTVRQRHQSPSPAKLLGRRILEDSLGNLQQCIVVRSAVARMDPLKSRAQGPAVVGQAAEDLRHCKGRLLV